MTQPDDTLQPGDVIADYRIDKVLGSGSFGVTYLGHDLQLNRGVAIKEYMPVQYARRQDGGTVSSRNAESASTFEWGLDRFSDEARTLAQFNHPNIVRVLRIIPDVNGTSYIVMELLSGTNLENIVERDGPLDSASFLSIFRQLLDGMQAVHGIGILHRDIKPANIVLEHRGPVLIDFGAARDLSMQAKAGFSALVTDGFSPPEQYSSKNAQSEASDIYALAATAYFLLSGKIPPPAAARHAGEDLDPITELNAELPADVVKGIEWGLELKVADRPGSIADWREAMPSLDASDRPDPEVVVIDRRGPPLNRRALLAIGGGLLVSGGAAAFLVGRDSSLNASSRPLTRSWTKSLGALSSEPYPAIAASSDAVFVTAHSIDDTGSDRLSVTRLDDTGEARLDYVHDVPGSRGHALLVRPDGSIVVGGETPDGALLVGLDKNLNRQWSKSFDPGSISSLLEDGDSIIAGLEGPDSSGTAKLLFLTSDGNLKSDQTLLDRQGDSVQRVVRLGDGSLGVLGLRLDQRTIDGRQQDVAGLWVAKLAISGEELWRISESGLGYANGLDLIEAGGDVFVCGRTSPDGAIESYRPLLMRIAGDGKKLWSRWDYAGDAGSGRAFGAVGDGSPRLYLAGRAGEPPKPRLSQVGPDGSLVWDEIETDAAGYAGAAAGLALRSDGSGFVVNVDAPSADTLQLSVSRLTT